LIIGTLPVESIKNYKYLKYFSTMYCIVLKKVYFCSMKIEKTNAQMRKGVLELCILSVISDKEVYTSNILEALKKAELLVVEGTVYPLLTRLKNDGLLSYRWEESTSGPPRKYYNLTDSGREVLDSLKSNWMQLSNSVNSLINFKSTSI